LKYLEGEERGLYYQMLYDKEKHNEIVNYTFSVILILISLNLISAAEYL
jgi:hypothetical protein